MKDNFKNEYKLIEMFIAEGLFKLSTNDRYTVIEPPCPNIKYSWDEILSRRDGYKSIINILTEENKKSPINKIDIKSVIELMETKENEYLDSNYQPKDPNFYVISIKIKNYIVRGYEIVDKYLAYDNVDITDEGIFNIIEPELLACYYANGYSYGFHEAKHVLIEENKKNPQNLYTFDEVIDLLEKNKFDFGPGNENPEVPTFYAIKIKRKRCDIIG